MSKTNRPDRRKTLSPAVRLEDWFRREVEVPAIASVGGRARLRVIVLLAATLALDSADKAMVGAVAVALKQSMNIGNLQLALLIAAPTFVTALATLPFGALTDRINRTRLLTGAIISWAALMVIGGAATSYVMLLLSRLALGVAIAVAVPVVASLIGDYFPPGERGRIWGYILAGELAGVAVGYLIAGNIAAVFSWRASFWALAALSLALAPAVWRYLSEPTRGGQSQIPPRAEKIPAAGEAREPEPKGNQTQGDSVGSSGTEVEDVVEQRDVRPHESQILHRDPKTMPFGQAARYVLSIRTNAVLIIASALGYFFFGALITFGIVFMRNRFGLGQAVATTLSVALGAGAIIGVLIAGRLADWLIQRGRINARVVVAAAAFLIAATCFLPALLIANICIAAPLLFLGAVALGGANPPLDAARLDIMHFDLYGRAESVRAMLRYTAQAISPLAFAGVFIVLSDGGNLLGVAVGNIPQASGALAHTFALMLIPLVAGGGLMFRAARSYPRDVATARASEQRSRSEHDG